MQNAEKALEYVQDGTVIGLGTGHAAAHFLQALADRIKQGLRVRGVPTSKASDTLARELGIPLTTLEEGMPLSVTIDGADEVDQHLNLIKGYGHALVREKIVASASRKLVILVGPEHTSEKCVATIGSRGKLPIEIVPFALPLCQRRLAELGYPIEVLQEDGQPLMSDNGNILAMCKIGPLTDPAHVNAQIRSIAGVVETGLFLGMADVVLIQDGDRLEVRERG
ncbi:ribose-5-phosphate isomerase RpiA [soil metagenome]